MRLGALVSTSQEVAATLRRNEKIGRLAERLRAIPVPEISPAVHFLSGTIRQGRLGIGGAILRDTQPGPAESESLSITDVDSSFEALRQTAGSGSAKKKSAILGSLLAQATAPEQSFLQRLLTGELRQGALESLILDAIALAANVPPAAVRQARMVANDLGAVAQAALQEGNAGLQRFGLTLFVPVQPMLAQPAASIEAVFAQLPIAAFELKLDGARVQVHKHGKDVRIYSRRMNDVTDSVPELVDAVRQLPARELILDGETIALSPEGAPLPFQTTMRRFGRRLDVARLREALPLRTFFFDCLRLEDTDLTGAPMTERIAALESRLNPTLLIPRQVTEDPAIASAFFEDALARGHEGVMAKALDSLYEAGSRGARWLKLKVAHTLDLVVLAAEWGNGRREGWLSNLHLGARDEVTGQYVMLGKTFKGLTDAMLAWQTERLLALESHRAGGVVVVRPELVVEIAFGDVQASPQYPAGVALRFARVKRHRPDKAASDADTLSAVLLIHTGATPRPRALLPGEVAP